MSERDSESVRDFERAGDAGPDSQSTFADGRDGQPRGNDERLGMRGRNTARDEGELLEDIDADRGSSDVERGAGDDADRRGSDVEP